MKPKDGITVKEALSLDLVERLKVVGGMDGINRVIKLVNIIEVPDIIDWLREGEFLLTTGYSFREYPELMKALIPRMAVCNCAGLAIKPKRFIKEIPTDLIKSAETYKIPLLEVPFNLSFSEITASLLAVISNRQNKILQQLEMVHRKLMDIVLHGSTLEDLCTETARLINNPVAIVDQEQGKIFSQNSDKQLLELFFSEENKVIKAEKLRLGNIKEIEYSLEYTSEHCSQKKNPLTIQAVRVPIMVNKNFYGYFYAISQNPICEFDILTLERAATTAALEFTKQKAIFEIEKNYYNEFLDLLLTCDFEGEEEIIKRGRIFKIDLQKPTAVIVINDESFNEMNNMHLPMDSINGQTAKEELLKAVYSFSKTQKNNLIAGIKGNNIVAITEVEGKNTNQSLKNTVKDLLYFLQQSKKKKSKSKESIKIGAGRPYQSIWKIAQSYQEARQALKICYLSKGLAIAHFEDLGFYKILYEKSREELNRYVDEYLSPLLEYDKNNNGELIKTLEHYYDSNRNLKKTAEKMYIHYNTILYRFKKIQKITGINLNGPEHALNMEIAINILKLFKYDSLNANV